MTETATTRQQITAALHDLILDVRAQGTREEWFDHPLLAATCIAMWSNKNSVSDTIARELLNALIHGLPAVYDVIDNAPERLCPMRRLLDRAFEVRAWMDEAAGAAWWQNTR